MPVVFVALDALPLTPNGKLDARALPDPFRNTAVIGDSFEPPAPGLEQLIADIWCELLRVDRVGAGDNFFDLGGNSLLALRVVTGLETRAGCRVPPRLLFFHTLRQVAAAAHQARTAGQIR
jgi:acyl carrier protein